MHYIIHMLFSYMHPPRVTFEYELYNTRTHDIVWVKQFNDFFVQNECAGKDIAEGTISSILSKNIPNMSVMQNKIMHDLSYIYSNYKHEGDKKIADKRRKEEMSVDIRFENHIKFGYPRPYNLIEYTLEAKQGKIFKMETLSEFYSHHMIIFKKEEISNLNIKLIVMMNQFLIKNLKILRYLKDKLFRETYEFLWRY